MWVSTEMASYIVRRCAMAAVLASVPSYREKQRAKMDNMPVSRLPRADHLFLSQKAKVGKTAVDEYVKDGMVLGIGSGSTVEFALKRLHEKIKSGELKDIKIVPCSQQATFLRTTPWPPAACLTVLR